MKFRRTKGMKKINISQQRVWSRTGLSSLVVAVMLSGCLPKATIVANNSTQPSDQGADSLPPDNNTPIPPAPTSAVRFKRIITVIFENTGFNSAAQQPYLAALAKSGALMTNFNGETHPSQGNYIALVSGDLQGVTGDGVYNLAATHIADLLEKKSLTWKVYAEGFPGNCSAKGTSGAYARKHNPFISFTNITKDPARCANILNADAFDADMKQGKMDNYIQYIPDLKNDGHDTGVAFASKWLEKKFSSYLNDPAFMRDTLFVLTFDENEGSSPNKIYTVLYGPMITAGIQSNVSMTHYSLLKLVEDNWELGHLTKNDSAASEMTGFWK